jgi:hypothetical protein
MKNNRYTGRPSLKWLFEQADAGADKNANIMWKKFFDTLYLFAKKAGCKGIEDCGRDYLKCSRTSYFQIANKSHKDDISIE